MGRKTKSKFKMDGPSLYQELSVNRNGYTNAKDGRANSSAFQYKSPAKIYSKPKGTKYKPVFKQTDDDLREYLLSEKFPTQEDVDNAIKDGSWSLKSPEFVEWYIYEIEKQMESLKKGSKELRYLEHLHGELVSSLPPKTLKMRY